MPAGSLDKVEAYLARVSEPSRSALRRLRAQIRAAAPDAQEGFGYGVPGFYQDGPLFYYGAAKAHCALYGLVPPVPAKELEGFAHSKGAIRFTPERPLPAALVRKLVRLRVASNKARAAKKGRGGRSAAKRKPRAAKAVSKPKGQKAQTGKRRAKR